MAEASPRVKARIAGACWLMTIVTGMVAMFAGGQASTAANLLATAFYLGATVLVYHLLKPVRILGALLAFGGVGWLTFLSPTLAESLSPYVILPGLLGEGALSVWLLTVGVDVPRWKGRAGGRLDPLPGTSAP